MKYKRLYISPIVEMSIGVSIASAAAIGIPLTWAPGQIGACAVFTNKKYAVKFIKYLGLKESDLIIVEPKC